MRFGLFSKLYDIAKEYDNVEYFIECQKNDEKIEYENAVLLLRFIHDTSHMSIRDIREYLGMTRPQFCEYYEIKMRTLEDWEYGKNPVPQRLLKLLSYTLVEDFIS